MKKYQDTLLGGQGGSTIWTASVMQIVCTKKGFQI